MFKNKKTIVLEEFDETGKCIKKTTTIEETENDFQLNPYTDQDIYVGDVPGTITTTGTNGKSFEYNTKNIGV